MSLAISFIIAICGAVMLVFSSRWGGRESTMITAALLSEDAPQPSESLRSPFSDQQQDNPKARRTAWLVGAGIGVLIALLFLKISVSTLLVVAMVGALAGELYTSRRKEAREKLRLRKMEFYLPTVMERIVMAVGSGLDVVPALREASHKGKDPVSELMRWIVGLSESGTPVESAFELASQQRVTSSVKHACIHLGLAYRQGGEIVRPLKELSDATQVAYQETVEEQIAKLPVKAVLPLVLTFTGLIVCFLTVPLMQVGSLTKEVASVASR
jgi:Flp pilus assembly protein TadB